MKVTHKTTDFQMTGFR